MESSISIEVKDAVTCSHRCKYYVGNATYQWCGLFNTMLGRFNTPLRVHFCLRIFGIPYEYENNTADDDQNC